MCEIYTIKKNKLTSFWWFEGGVSGGLGLGILWIILTGPGIKTDSSLSKGLSRTIMGKGMTKKIKNN